MEKKDKEKKIPRKGIVGFRLHDAITDRIEVTGRTVNTQAREITEALPFLREKTFREIKGKFFAEELNYLIDSFYGTILDPSQKVDGDFIAWHVEESQKYDNLGQKWGVVVDKFMDKLKELTAAQSYFLVDFVLTFLDCHESLDLDEYVKRLI